MKYADMVGFVGKQEKEFAEKCDLLKPRIIEIIKNSPDQRCWLSQITRQLFIDDEHASYSDTGEVTAYVTLDMMSQNELKWDKDLKLMFIESYVHNDT